METRKQKLQRWLVDSYDLLDTLHGSDDEVTKDSVRNRIEELESELSDIPNNDNVPLERMDYEKELLTIMMEECGEVIQACSKIIRFGATHESLSHLEKELGDLYQMMELAHQYDLVSWTKIDEASDKKKEKLATWSSLVDI